MLRWLAVMPELRDGGGLKESDEPGNIIVGGGTNESTATAVTEAEAQLGLRVCRLRDLRHAQGPAAVAESGVIVALHRDTQTCRVRWGGVSSVGGATTGSEGSEGSEGGFSFGPPPGAPQDVWALGLLFIELLLGTAVKTSSVVVQPPRLTEAAAAADTAAPQQLRIYVPACLCHHDGCMSDLPPIAPGEAQDGGDSGPRYGGASSGGDGNGVSGECVGQKTEQHRAHAFALEEARRLRDECKRELALAEPALSAAVEALRRLKKQDLSEIKCFKQPPTGVKITVEAQMWHNRRTGGRLVS